MEAILVEFQKNFQNHLLKNQHDRISEILMSTDIKKFYSYVFNLQEALDIWPSLFHIVNQGGIQVLIEIIPETILNAQIELQKKKQFSQNFVKDRIIVEFSHIPAIKKFYLRSLNLLQQNHLNNLVLIKGTVVRTGQIKSLTVQCQVKCEKCESIITVESDLNDQNKLQIPNSCTNQVEKQQKNNFIKMLMTRHFNQRKKQEPQNERKPQTKKQVSCGGKVFIPIEGSQQLLDYQEVKIQDRLVNQGDQSFKRGLKVCLFGYQVNQCKAGDDVIIGGIIIPQWIKVQQGQRPLVQLVMKCLYIELLNKPKKYDEQKLVNQPSLKYDGLNDFELRKLLCNSTCPHIFNRNDLKLGLLLCLVGGTVNTNENTIIRGNSHLLLVGEPGTGKSSILKYASEISTRSVYANGIGCTSAGLTVSYIREGNEWIIEPGAFVLADQGICCIDEFNLIGKQQLDSTLEALEQQTVSVQKAGQAAKLNARTTLLAACNPLGPGQKYRQDLTLEENTALSSPMISRFDLIFILADEITDHSDQESSSFILDRYLQTTEIVRNQVQSKDLLSKEELREYLYKAKHDYNPSVSQEAHIIIQRYYVKLRQKQQRTTVRSLESVIRLSQAYARLMMRNEIQKEDVLNVLSLIEISGDGKRLGMIWKDTESDLDYQEYKKWIKQVEQKLEE